MRSQFIWNFGFWGVVSLKVRPSTWSCLKIAAKIVCVEEDLRARQERLMLLDEVQLLPPMLALLRGLSDAAHRLALSHSSAKLSKAGHGYLLLGW